MGKWAERFMTMAELVASWSKDPSTKVGCVLVDAQRRIVGMGYNGFPRGVADEADRYDDRPTKYAMVVHAEANAILNAVGDVKGCTAYVTHHPCADCAGLLIQSGVSSIITKRPDPGIQKRFCESFKHSQSMLDEAGVDLMFTS